MSSRPQEPRIAVIDEVRATGPILLGDIARQLQGALPRHTVVQAAYQASLHGELVQDLHGRLHLPPGN